MARPKQDFGKSTNDNMIIRVGPLSLNKILSKIVCECEGLSLRPPGYENCNQFYLLDCSQNREPSAPEIQPFLSQIARDSRLPPTPHVGVAFPPEDNSQRP